MSHPGGMLASMEDEELTPEGLEAWQRWADEVERRSRACVEAASGNWGGDDRRTAEPE